MSNISPICHSSLSFINPIIGEEITFGNTFVVSQLRLPLGDTKGANKIEQFRQVLLKVKQSVPSRASLLIQRTVGHRLLAYLPKHMTKMLFKFDSITMSVTPIPVANTNFRVAGYEWQDVTAWATNGRKIGLTVFFTSYNRRLQIVVYSDTVRSINLKKLSRHISEKIDKLI